MGLRYNLNYRSMGMCKVHDTFYRRHILSLEAFEYITNIMANLRRDTTSTAMQQKPNHQSALKNINYLVGWWYQQGCSM